MASTTPQSTTPHIIIIIVGCPASGKGTHRPQIAEHKMYAHISLGDHLRAISVYDPLIVGPEVFGNMPHNVFLACVRERKLVPPNFIVDILAYEIRVQILANGETGFVIDGFPRDVESAKLCEEKVKKEWATRSEAVYSFECPEEVAVGRFVNRARDRGDAEEQKAIFKTRFQEFEEKNPAILEYYRGLGVPLQVFDTSMGTEAVWGAIVQVL